MQEGSNIIGIIAGNGKLPAIVAKKARQEGYKVCAVCFDKKNYPEILLNSDKATYLGPGQTRKILSYLQENDVKELIFIGKVSKELMVRNPRLDKLALSHIKKMKRFNDDAIMLAAVEVLEENGIKVLEQTHFIKDFFAKPGLIAGNAPTETRYADITYGMEIAKEIGRMDIGQTVVVKDKMIMAVEAIEGTDQAIKRGCRLGRKNSTIVKVSKPSQDQRFDIPVVGCKTLLTMKRYKADVLAIEANETLIVNEEEFIKLANKLNITVIAV